MSTKVAMGNQYDEILEEIRSNDLGKIHPEILEKYCIELELQLKSARAQDKYPELMKQYRRLIDIAFKLPDILDDEKTMNHIAASEKEYSKIKASIHTLEDFAQINDYQWKLVEKRSKQKYPNERNQLTGILINLLIPAYYTEIVNEITALIDTMEAKSVNFTEWEEKIMEVIRDIKKLESGFPTGNHMDSILRYQSLLNCLISKISEFDDSQTPHGELLI